MRKTKRKQKLFSKQKLLSALLCVCLVGQSMTVTAFAEETNAAEITNEAVDVTVSEMDVLDSTLDYGTTSGDEGSEGDGEQIENNIALADSSDYFASWKIKKIGFNVYIYEGYPETDYVSTYYHMNLYDAEGNLQKNRGLQKFFPVYEDTAYITFEYDSYAAGNRVQEYSDKFYISEGNPDDVFEAEVVSTGSSDVETKIMFEKDKFLPLDGVNITQYFYVDLLYGTQEDESTWESNKKQMVVSSLSGGSEQTLIYSGLQPDTTYYAKLCIKTNSSVYDTYDDNPCVQYIDLGSFRTKANNTYNLKTAFPDETFRAMVLEQLQNQDETLTEDSDVTSVQLEAISNISENRSSLDTAAVKDITGVELLTNLRGLYLKNHEITSVEAIDWSKLNRLQSLNLGGNELTQFPDLRQNMQLSNITLSENLMSDEEVIRGIQKLPASVNYYIGNFANQRGASVGLLLEDSYYLYGTAVPVTMQVTGVKSGLGYTAKVYIDDQEAEMNMTTSAPLGLSTADAGLTAGEHTVYAEFYNGEEKVAETSVYSLNVVDENAFLKEDKLYGINGVNRFYIYASYYTLQANSVSKMSMVDDTGKVYAKSSGIGSGSNYTDPRYQGAIYDSNRKVSGYFGNIHGIYNRVPEGSYDLRIDFEDGTYELVEDYIQVVNDTEAVVTREYSASSYDNSSEYIHLQLNGQNIDPSQLNYELSWKSVKSDVSYVGYKNITDGVIVKLQKEPWMSGLLYEADLIISPKEGYELVNETVVIDGVYSNNGVYYCAFNPVTNQLEVAFSDSLNAEGKTVEAEIALGFYTTDYPAIASGSAVVTDGIAYFDLKTPEGTQYVLDRQEHWARFNIGGTTYRYNTSLSNYSSSSKTDYWSTYPMAEGMEQMKLFYYSSIPYETAITDEFSATLSGSGIEAQSATEITVTERTDNNGTIHVIFDTKDLTAGTYVVDLSRNGEAYATGALEIKSADKFELTSVSTSWEDSSTFYVYLKTPFTRESDEYEVVLTDSSGNEVEGLTVTSKKYFGYMYLYVTGLNYEDALYNYYVKVIHKTLGEPVKADGTAYYSDEKGEYRSISFGKSGVTTVNGRAIGVSNMQRLSFPVTLMVYKPYEVELVQEYTIESNEGLDTYFYFPVEFCASLPNPDATYDLLVHDADDYMYVHTKVVFGSRYGEVIKNWTVSIDRSTLYIDKEDECTATIQVKDSQQNPTFQSSDTNVVTVAALESDPQKAIVTAVGVGIAKITVTVDGITKEIPIVVDRLVTLEGVCFDQDTLTLEAGNSKELIVNTIPADMWNAEWVVSYETSDAEVVSVEKAATNNSITVLALKKGSAVITAKVSVDGTEYSCKCDVTVCEAAGGNTNDGNDNNDPTDTNDGNDAGDNTNTNDGEDDEKEDGEAGTIEDGFIVSAIPNQTYSGKAIKPAVIVKQDGKKLAAGVDYTVSYKNNTNAATTESAKAPMVIVKGKGNYAGTITVKFNIVPKELTAATFTEMIADANGKVHNLKPTVKLDGKKLVVNKDYALEYPDKGNGAYKEPGTYSVLIQGKGNYQGTITTSLIILGENQLKASKLKVAKIAAINYVEGTPATPAPEVSYKGTKLELGKDYAISYVNNDRAGKATLIITGLKNAEGTFVAGSVKKTFTIKGTALKKAKAEYNNKVLYTGSEICPDVKLTVGNTTLRPGIDYAVEYTKNVNVGKATIIFTGKGGYTGTLKKTFTIQADASVADKLAVSYASGKAEAAFVAKGAKPAVKVELGDTVLKLGKDYTVSYKNNKKLAAADATKAPTVVIKGKGNYKFTKSVTFAIVEKNLTDVDISVESADKFVGGKKGYLSAPVVKDGNGKKLKVNKDYKVVGYTVNGAAFDGLGEVAAGTVVTVTVEGMGSYKSQATTTYLIANNDISKVKVNKPQLEYNGDKVKFTEEMFAEGKLELTDKATNKKLIYGTDFVVVGYKNNTKKGTATVTVRGIGEYGGTKSVKFSIVSKTLQK